MKGKTEVQIDWSKAPEGTTHANIEAGPHSWRMVIGEQAFYWAYNSRWERLSSWHLAEYVERPARAAWNGKGLPPVGTLCLYQAGSRKPQKVHILAYGKHGSHDAVLMAKDQMGPGKMIGRIVEPENFSPILTAEEKVAREIKDIQAVLHGAEDDLDCAQRLVAAGYRKVEGGAQ